MTGLGLGDMALVEINEAFAPVRRRREGAGLDRSITNVNGGAIALGRTSPPPARGSLRR